MKIINLKHEGHDIMFVCDSRNTRHGFAHDATLFVNGSQWGKASCYYLNRTWENWSFQSACLKAVQEQLDASIACVKSYFKASNHISRVTAKRQPELDAMIDADADVTFLRGLKKRLREEHF